jgi:hypothetical protein
LNQFLIFSSIQAIGEEAFSGIEASLLILNGSALCNDILVIKELWILSTDVHFCGNFNTSTVSTDFP